MASVTYPVTALTFDGVTLGAFGDLAADMTLVLGTTDGADDLGRVRVQNVATSTTIPVGRISQGTEDGTLNVTDNAYITVWGDDWRVWAKIPYDAPSGIDYKDSTVEVGTYNEEPPPVAVMGAGFADYIDNDDVITVTFDGTDSYAVADAATIASYAWTIEDGTLTAGTLTSSSITATFPAGFRYVALTVTDSNGNPHSTRRPVLAVDPDDDPTIKFQVPSHRIEMRGQTIAFELFDNTPRTTFPDGGLVMFWADAPIDPTDRSHMWFIGYHQSDSFNIRATPTGLIRTTVLNCVDAAGRLASLPGFPQALQREPEEDEDGNPLDIMWALMPTLDMRKCLHYLAFWHSTALNVTDFLLPESLSDYPAMRLDSTGASLYDQINSRAQSCVPDHWLTCNIQGQLAVRPDWMLLDFDDRPADTAGTLTEDFWQSIDVDYTRPPRVYHLSSSAVVCSTDWLMLGGVKTLPLAFCDAPGTAFGQGVSESVTGEKLTISQEALNACEGHRYARLNARYGLFTIVEPTGDIQDFQPAHMLPVQLNISAATAAQRGLDFTTARGLVRSIDMRYNHTEHGTWVSPTLQWEREVIGLPAVTHIPDEPDDPDYEVPEPPPATAPPDFGLVDGQNLVAGIGLDGYVYRTSNFQNASPTWDRVDTTIADTIYSFVVDPFSPGYINGAGAINGWIVNDTDIYRVTDLFGSVVATSVYTFDEPTVAASFHWRSIQASFGAYFAEGANPWLLCVSYYGDTAGHTGTWATYSTDGGVTWADEVQISAHYSESTPTHFNQIGVYASPKTPGLGYTAAYIETSPLPLADGFVTTDWGATWTRVSEDVVNNPAQPLPLWIKYNNDTAGRTLLGAGKSASLQSFAADSDGGPVVEEEFWLCLALAPNTKRVELSGSWRTIFYSPGPGNCLSTIDLVDSPSTTRTDNLTHTTPASTASGTTAGTFTATITFPAFATNNWPFNTSNYLTAPISDATYLQLYSSVSSFNPDLVECTSIGALTVTEIELDDGTIYVPPEYGEGMIQPGHAFAGQIYLPWDDNPTEELAYYGYMNLLVNRDIALREAVGITQADISPSDSGVDFGINTYGFAVRSFDNDRQFMALAGIGNSTSSDAANDKVGLWVSSNAGAAWTNILTPVAASNAPRGLQVAFGGDNSDVLFAWGGVSDGSLAAIYYSDDFGATLDSREGNINSLGTTTLIGIAGGPSA